MGVSKTRITIKGTIVKIYNTNAGGEYPIHGAYNAGDDEWILACWTKEGRKFNGTRHELDLLDDTARSQE